LRARRWRRPIAPPIASCSQPDRHVRPGDDRGDGLRRAGRRLSRGRPARRGRRAGPGRRWHLPRPVGACHEDLAAIAQALACHRDDAAAYGASYSWEAATTSSKPRWPAPSGRSPAPPDQGARRPAP
jgi:hypothetical protein